MSCTLCVGPLRSCESYFLAFRNMVRDQWSFFSSLTLLRRLLFHCPKLLYVPRDHYIFLWKHSSMHEYMTIGFSACKIVDTLLICFEIQYWVNYSHSLSTAGFRLISDPADVTGCKDCQSSRLLMETQTFLSSLILTRVSSFVWFLYFCCLFE